MFLVYNFHPIKWFVYNPWLYKMVVPVTCFDPEIFWQFSQKMIKPVYSWFSSLIGYNPIHIVYSIIRLWEFQKDQTACSCFKQGSVSHTSTKHPMRQHCIAINSWGQVPSKFSRANAAAEAVNQIQKGKENPWGQKVVPLQKPRSAT